jgi:hypothetical protein
MWQCGGAAVVAAASDQATVRCLHAEAHSKLWLLPPQGGKVCVLDCGIAAATVSSVSCCLLCVLQNGKPREAD